MYLYPFSPRRGGVPSRLPEPYGNTGVNPVLHARLSLPGSRRSLNVCMLITASVFTMTGGWGLCLTLRWQVSESRISSAMALQKERCGQSRSTLSNAFGDTGPRAWGTAPARGMHEGSVHRAQASRLPALPAHGGILLPGWSYRIVDSGARDTPWGRSVPTARRALAFGTNVCLASGWFAGGFAPCPPAPVSEGASLINRHTRYVATPPGTSKRPSRPRGGRPCSAMG